MNEEINKKIEILRQTYLTPEDQRTIGEVERTLARKYQESRLIENDFVKMIVDDAVKRIKEIEYLLCTDRSLKDDERNSLFKEKDCINYYIIQRLGGKKAKQEIEFIRDSIEYKL